MFKRFLLTILIVRVSLSGDLSKQDGFTQEDREKLIRLEATLKVFMEQTNRRFEDINKRFDQLYTFLWIITGIFTAIMVATIGFAFWDRKSTIKRGWE